MKVWTYLFTDPKAAYANVRVVAADRVEADGLALKLKPPAPVHDPGVIFQYAGSDMGAARILRKERRKKLK